MFITFIEQFVKMSCAWAESDYSSVCEQCREIFLVSKMSKKRNKKIHYHRVLLANVKFETQ